MAGLSELRAAAAGTPADPLGEPSEAPGVTSLPPVEESGGSPSGADTPEPGSAPFGVHQTTTPLGVEIYYQAGPKRLYRIAVPDTHPKRWREVPSVSEILDILHKPGLTWWGMKIGVEGVLSLFHDFNLDPMQIGDVDKIVELLTKNKLTVNHVRDKAGDRGTAVHDALEAWALSGKLAPPNIFDEEERGYVMGLNDFLTDASPEPIVSEVMVASPKWGFAGRFDLLAEIPDKARVVTKSYPKRASKVEPVQGGRYLLDLKTSKGVYNSHHLQLAAYELAYRECYDPDEIEYRGIIHVFQDGRYELVDGKGSTQDFITILDAHRALGNVK